MKKRVSLLGVCLLVLCGILTECMPVSLGWHFGFFMPEVIEADELQVDLNAISHIVDASIATEDALTKAIQNAKQGESIIVYKEKLSVTKTEWEAIRKKQLTVVLMEVYDWDEYHEVANGVVFEGKKMESLNYGEAIFRVGPTGVYDDVYGMRHDYRFNVYYCDEKGTYIGSSDEDAQFAQKIPGVSNTIWNTERSDCGPYKDELYLVMRQIKYLDLNMNQCWSWYLGNDGKTCTGENSFYLVPCEVGENWWVGESVYNPDDVSPIVADNNNYKAGDTLLGNLVEQRNYNISVANAKNAFTVQMQLPSDVGDEIYWEYLFSIDDRKYPWENNNAQYIEIYIKEGEMIFRTLDNEGNKEKTKIGEFENFKGKTITCCFYEKEGQNRAEIYLGDDIIFEKNISEKMAYGRFNTFYHLGNSLTSYPDYYGEYRGNKVLTETTAAVYAGKVLADGTVVDVAPKPEPSESETQEPSESETQEPSESETQKPSESETQEPSESQTQEPSESETQEPSASETQEPSETQKPSENGTQKPSETDKPVDNQNSNEQQDTTEDTEIPIVIPVVVAVGGIGAVGVAGVLFKDAILAVIKGILSIFGK